MQTSSLAKILTLSGSIPFVLSAMLMIFYPDNGSYQAIVQKIVATYAAIILSFLAGVHWGIAIINHSKISLYLLVSSNCIALLAWTCLLISNYLSAIILLMVGFFIQWIIDYALFKRMILKKWFIQLRSIITIIVILCLTILCLSTS